MNPRVSQRLALRVACCLCLSFFTLVAQGREQDMRVLIIHSYHNGFPWTDGINQGILMELETRYGTSLDTRVEYMDTKRFEHEEYLDRCREYLKKKYLNTHVDLVIVSDNSAYSLITTYRNEIYPSTPLVFCGLNYLDTLLPGTTGIMETVDVKSNIGIIQKIHPGLSKLNIIVDRSITGIIIQAEVEEAIQDITPGLPHEYLTDYTLDELKTRVSQIPEGEVILLFNFAFDREGKPLAYERMMQELTAGNQVPVYSNSDFFLGKGIVGGMITSSLLHGQETGKLAIRVLSGESPDSIAIQTGKTQYMFDNHLLKNYRLNRLVLPPGSLIINTPIAVVRENPGLFILIGVILVLLVLLVLVLVTIVRRGKLMLKQERTYLTEIEEKSQKIEEALAKAESATQLQKAFLNNLSHEIRTPMNGIVGFVTLLKTQFERNNKEFEYLELIQANSNQLLSIIDSIVEMSKLETKLVMTNRGEANLNEVLDEIYQKYLPAVKRNSELTIELYKPLPNTKDLIETDRGKLIQVLNNLMNNAVKFTPKGKIVIGYEPRENEIYFFVRDTGIGIPPEHHKSIFNQFDQVDKGHNRQYGGTGLGLPIAKAYVDLLEGTIGLDSGPGDGSCFFFTIPRVQYSGGENNKSISQDRK